MFRGTSWHDHETSFDFTGRNVLVTGAAQGIGFEVAKAFREAGAHASVMDNSPAILDAVWSAELGVNPVAVDVADSRAVAPAFDRIVGSGGEIDTVVNNAGIARDAVVWKLADQDWKAVLDVHLGGMFNVTRAAILAMRNNGFGRIINVTPACRGMSGSPTTLPPKRES